MSTDDDFGRSAFVNCPFDRDYDHILQAVLVCLARFGLKPRIAIERSDAGELRLSFARRMPEGYRHGLLDEDSGRPAK